MEAHVTDYENALRDALMEVYTLYRLPLSKVSGCYFHYTQTIKDLKWFFEATIHLNILSHFQFVAETIA